MAITVRYRVPVNGQKQYIPNTGVLMRSVTIVNQSGDSLTFATQWDSYTVEAGNVESYDIAATQQFTTQTASNTTGEAWVVLSDGPAASENLAKNLQAQVVNFPSTQSVTISGTPNVNIASGSVNANITNGTINTQDVIIENNTGILTGLLPSDTNGYSIATNTEQTFTFTKALAGLGLSLQSAGIGRVNAWIVSFTQIIFLLRDIPIDVGPNSNNPIMKRFAEPIIENDVLHIRWDDAGSPLIAILRV